MIFIYGSHKNESIQYAREHGLKKDEYEHLQNPNQLSGRRKPIVIKVGRWYERDDFVFIKEAVESLGGEIFTQSKLNQKRS